MGDDCMVAVSPAMFETFFLPYNNRISRAFGGVCYHCCLKNDFQFGGMAKTEGFLGADGDPEWNDLEKLVSMLDGRGFFIRKLGPGQMEIIRRFKGRVGCLLQASGTDRDDAIRNARKLLAEV